MPSFNKVFLMGNLTRDPEIRYTTGGAGVCSFGIAVNRRFTTSHGEDREETCFVDIEVWGKQGESCNTYLTKGSPVFIDGRLRFDQWEDRDSGRKRSRLTVTALQVQFLSQPSRQSDYNEIPAEYSGGRAAKDFSNQERPSEEGVVRNVTPEPPPFPSQDNEKDAKPATDAFNADDDESMDDIPF
jgi:single-strand DNA-binding protein